ncbi:MAG TPA: hypothetical protein VKQ36_04875, partial [Ktedonobacterales bacterium]|nr:hypothetical protein [Ktedonobacterales bacterium]
QIAHAEALVDAMPRPLQAWYHTPNWYASRLWLAQHHSEFPRDSIEVFAAATRQARQNGAEMAARSLERHAQLLIEATRTGVDSAYRAIIGAEAFTPPSPQSQAGSSDVALDEAAIGHYFDLLVAWIETPDWGSSRQFLYAHPDLLSDTAEAVLEQMYEIETKDRPIIEEHQHLLRAARRHGIDAAYTTRGHAHDSREGHAAIDPDSGLTPAQQRLLPTLIDWIKTPDWDSSRDFLRAHVELLSHDSELLLAGLYAAQETDGARQTIVDHVWLIRAAQQGGIDAAYNSFLTILRERQQSARQGGPTPL